MSEKKSKHTKKKIFNLDLDIEARMREYTQANQMTEAAFIRLAIIEKLNRAQSEENNMKQSTQVQDLPTIELAYQELMNRMDKLQASVDYLTDLPKQSEPEFITQVQEAKKLLVENKPKTYQQASTVISDVEVMTEAITQLLNEKQVVYKRRRLIWL